MSDEDPLHELEEVIALSSAGKLPQEAGAWAESAYTTAEEILETIESMQSNGIDAPTPGQVDALENIFKAACRWLRHR